MTDYPGIYRARCVSVKDDKITAYVPQVFGDKRITITSRTGGLPDPNSNGWVLFESAQASLPVWQSSQVGVTQGGGGSSSVGEAISVAWPPTTSFPSGTDYLLASTTLPAGKSVLILSAQFSASDELSTSPTVNFVPSIDAYLLGGSLFAPYSGGLSNQVSIAVVDLPQSTDVSLVAAVTTVSDPSDTASTGCLVVIPSV